MNTMPSEVNQLSHTARARANSIPNIAATGKKQRPWGWKSLAHEQKYLHKRYVNSPLPLAGEGGASAPGEGAFDVLKPSPPPLSRKRERGERRAKEKSGLPLARQ
jgi:hypothetical protein